MSEGEGKVAETLKMVDDFHGGETKKYAMVNEKAVLPREVMIELRLEPIAAACHMANRAYCIGIGDLSQPTWEDAPEWQKSSAMNGVRVKLLDPTVTPEQSHEGWLAEKTAAGWAYGSVKDPEKKEHPCFKPYAELDDAAKMKDDIFLVTVISVGKTMGLIE
jgi:RyR domain